MEETRKTKVLVTDGGSVNALAAVRYLGLQGLQVFVIAYNSVAISRFSKYCRKFFLASHPKKDEALFFRQLLKVVQEENIDFVLPVGFYAHKALVNNGSVLEKYTKVCLPQKTAFDTATSKILSTALADAAGVKVPKTIVVKHIGDLKTLDTLRYPVVIKSAKEIGGRMLAYAANHEKLEIEFHEMVKKHQLEPQDFPIIQEFITGNGVGYFAFCKHGEVVAEFMHERVREFPVSGGRSVCAMSIHNEKLMQSGRKLLGELKWNGAAMVEFKRTADDEFYFLEINPKLWGSLELALAAGVDFPQLMLKDALGMPFSRMPEYRRGLYFQWLLNGELYYFVNRPWHILRILKCLPKSKKDFWLSDIKPNLVQGLLIFLDLYKAIQARLRT